MSLSSSLFSLTSAAVSKANGSSSPSVLSGDVWFPSVAE